MSDTSVEKVPKERIRCFDMFKGVAIIVIVFVHLFVLVPKGGNSGTRVSIPLQFLYLGLMTFFVTSGYFYKPERGFVSNFKKRVLQLVVAIVGCGLLTPLVVWGYMAIVGVDAGFDDYITCVKSCIGYPFFQSLDLTYEDKSVSILAVLNGTYFLKVMVWAFLIFYAIADYVLKDMRRTAVAIVVLVGLTALFLEWPRLYFPWMAHMAPISAALMLAGAAMAKYNVAELIERNWRSKRFVLYLLVSVVATVVLLSVFPPGNDFNVSKLGSYGGWSAFPYFLESVFASFILLTFVAFLSKIAPLYKVVGFVGKHTLAILLFHTAVARMIIVLFEDLPKEAFFPVLPVSTDVAVGIVTLVIILVLAELYPKLISKLRSVLTKV